MAAALKPFRIGRLTIDFPVVLAALAGISDLTYRLICRRRGAPYCTTEAMLDREMLVDGKLRRRLVRITPEDHPLAGQIIGNDPRVMAQAAAVLCQMGFDVVDLNFACPVRRVITRRRGGHLMRHPQQAIEIIRAVAAVVEGPLTVKLRRSFLESDKSGETFFRIAEAAFDAGAAAVCLHARSVEAKYAGPADWEFLAKVKRHFAGCTLIGSGDVHRPADALAMLEQTGVDAVAVARGAIGNPWFFRQVRDLLAGGPLFKPTLAQQRELMLQQLADVTEIYKPQKLAGIMRKFGVKYARLHPAPAKVRSAFAGVKRLDQWHAVLDEHYSGTLSPQAPAATPSEAPRG